LQRAWSVRQDAGQGVLAQFVEYVQLKRATGLSGYEYFLYELYRRNRPREEKLQYLTRTRHERYLAPLGLEQYDVLLADKFVFKQYVASLGLPVPRTYGVYHPFHGRTAEGAPLRTEQQFRAWLAAFTRPGLVIKPVRGGCGRNVLVFQGRSAEPTLGLVHVNGATYPPDRLACLLSCDDPHTHPGYLLEERVQQHPFLAKYNPSTLHTTRVVTLRADDGTLHVVGATLKIGQDSSGVESLVEEHLCVPLDIETGALGLAARRERLKFLRLTHDPVNRQRIVGETLPMWPNVKQLALQAAETVRCLRSIGWDIGLTAQGPVLIEGNRIWGEEILQIAQGRGLWTPNLHSWLRASTCPEATASGRRTRGPSSDRV
jgi:hypothetical protein